MLSQILDVADFETRRLRCREDHRNALQIRVRKNIILDERATAFRSRPNAFANRMVQEDSARFKQAKRFLKIFAQMVRADVFRHPDARDRVERSFFRQVAIILEPDFHSLSESASFDLKNASSALAKLDQPTAERLADAKYLGKLDFIEFNLKDAMTRIDGDVGGAIGLGAGFSFADGD